MIKTEQLPHTTHDGSHRNEYVTIEGVFYNVVNGRLFLATGAIAAFDIACRGKMTEPRTSLH